MSEEKIDSSEIWEEQKRKKISFCGSEALPRAQYTPNLMK